MPYKERSKFKVFNEINTKCQKGNLPPIISNTANSLYSAISDTKISRGNNRKGIIDSLKVILKINFHSNQTRSIGGPITKNLLVIFIK